MDMMSEAAIEESGGTIIATPLLIVGAGFAGVAMALALKKRGISEFTIVERAADVGGVWRDNSYPGAACDVVSRLYALSADTNYPWSDPFGPRDEILDHIRRVVDRHDLRRHMVFGVEVSSAAFDEHSGLWTIKAADGRLFETSMFVSAVGLFNRPFIPEVEGRENFAGPAFHSAGWDHNVDFSGKRVAVVGNGASCVQFLPRIAPLAGHVALFQRTPQYVMPKTVHPGTSKFDRWLGRYRWLRPLARLNVFLTFERMMRRRLHRPDLRKAGEAAFRQMLAEKIADPDLRARLTPDYSLGCKRILVSNNWYDALNRPNVEVVSDRIAAIRPDGIETINGKLHEADVLIWGTGFTPTDFLQPMKITGTYGKKLEDVWKHGAEAYLGMTVSGFPNFFMLYGPNTNAVSSIVYVLECQARYIADAFVKLRQRHARYMDVKPSVLKTFAGEMQERLSKTVAAEANCFSYYKTDEGRLTTNWPGYALEYRWRTRKVNQADFTFEPEQAVQNAAA